MTTKLYKNTGQKSSVCLNLSLTLDDLKNDKLVVKQQYSEQKYEPRNLSANPVSGIIDTILDLADARAFEEQQRQIQRRKKRKLQ